MESVFSSSSITTVPKLAPVSIKIHHSRLLNNDGELIGVFFCKLDQYANEVHSRAHQLGTESSTTEPVRPVDMKFCIDADCLESTIALGFIDKVSTHDYLTDAEVRTFLE